MVWPLEATISLRAEQKVSKELGDKIYLGQMVGKEVRSQEGLASLQIGKRQTKNILNIFFSILKNICTGENSFTPST